MPPILVDDVIATDTLATRVPRQRTVHGEPQAMQRLQEALAGSPRTMLRTLADIALDLCHAQSAGISLLEESDGRRYFRWHATSGAWKDLLWNTLPREFSPCGTVLDRNATLLMLDPERYFTGLSQLSPRITEVLLVPFHVDGQAVGTVWVIAHDEKCHFDAHDRGVLLELTRFAAAAYQRLQSLKHDDIRDLARMRFSKYRKPEIDSN